jgi:hypothetical protein
MVYDLSKSPDITEGLPALLTQRVNPIANLSSKIAYDLDINDLRFCLRPDAENPYMRQSLPIQKQQQDTSKEPGEQTLDGYWLRSQDSWHRGAGVNFYEPGSDEDTRYRFYESSGVNVWTEGIISPLHKMTNQQTAVANVYIQDAGGGSFAITDDSSLVSWIGPSITLGSPPAGHTGRWYFFGTNKIVKVGWTSPADPTIGVWNERTSTLIGKNATVRPDVWYLKDRLLVSQGANLFEVPLNAASAVDLADKTAALYAPADTGTTWVDAAEGPSAIYAAFTDGAHDGIVRFTLQDASSGQTPKLSQAYRVLDLPAGERIYKIFGYLGRFLLLSTSAGIRVCAVDGNADLTMGQVMVPAASTGRFNSFHADGRYVYVGGADVPKADTSGTGNLMDWGTAAGFVRINLGESTGDSQSLTFAWAMDERTAASGTVTSSARISAGKQAIAVAGSGVWVTDTVNLEPKGYLAMGRVRYATYAKKVFRALDLDGTLPGACGMQVQLLDERDLSAFSVSMDQSTGLFTMLGLDLTKSYRYIRPVITMTASGSSGPTLSQVQLRSLPTPGRLRQIRYPLKCEDREEDRRGNTYGHKGFAEERVYALEALEDAGLPVSVIDRRTGESYSAMIDEIRFVGTTAPDRNNRNFSGTLWVTLTKLS